MFDLFNIEITPRFHCRWDLTKGCLLTLILLAFACVVTADAGKAVPADDVKCVESLTAVDARFERDEHGCIVGVVLGCKTTDDALENLGGLPHLQKLTVQCARKVTDDGLKHIEGLTQLRYLWFGYSNITDRALVHLEKLNNLEELFVGVLDSEFRSDGLVYLRKLKTLRKLTLRRTKITEGDVTELKRFLPKCEIEVTQ